MSDSELVHRQKCEHGDTTEHTTPECEAQDRHTMSQSCYCPGGFEVVLDPDKVLVLRDDFTGVVVTVSDVLAVLDKEVEK